MTSAFSETLTCPEESESPPSTLLFNSSWVLQSPQEKLKTIFTQNFKREGGGGGEQGVLWEMRKWRTLSATRTTSSQSLRYPYSVILGADQKDRSLWERDCFSRSVYENLQVRFLHSPIHLLYIQQFHSILHKSYQTNKPWTRTTRSNTYNLGPERTVKRRNQRRLNEYRSK